MSRPTVTIPTPHGGVTLPLAQVLALGDALKDLTERGAVDVVWHVNDCGCCVSAHGAAGGWLIGSDGSADWHDTPC